MASVFISALLSKSNKEVKKLNCIIYVFRLFFKNGGYIIIRKSHYGRYPHFIWAKNINGLEVKHIAPTTDAPPKNILDLFYFEAYEKDRDNDKT
jgi:hypothetical protein